ncbi:MAG: helix-turn-helix transcriptional regulator [Desulfobacterales bacterium]|nr:helix-turn-helix transcriptional regulator [Desulfobacterales bacterium]
MNAPINIQIIAHNGEPAFVVIPYDEYIQIFPQISNEPRIPEKNSLPHEVVGMTIKKGYTLIRAWRKYLNLTQIQIAERIAVTQEIFSQMESGKKHIGVKTLRKIAKAMNINVKQLMEH